MVRMIHIMNGSSPSDSHSVLPVGCVDMTNRENRGLDIPMDALEPIVQHYRFRLGGPLSRADIWALAATVGTDMSLHPDDRIPFPFRWYGRKDCTERDGPCLGHNGTPVPCTHDRGPHHSHPTIHFNSAEVYHFFLVEFGFSMRETIVAMGAHTIGTLSVEVRVTSRAQQSN